MGVMTEPSAKSITCKIGVVRPVLNGTKPFSPSNKRVESAKAYA